MGNKITKCVAAGFVTDVLGRSIDDMNAAQNAKMIKAAQKHDYDNKYPRKPTEQKMNMIQTMTDAMPDFARLALDNTLGQTKDEAVDGQGLGVIPSQKLFHQEMRACLAQAIVSLGFNDKHLKAFKALHSSDAKKEVGAAMEEMTIEQQDAVHALLVELNLRQAGDAVDSKTAHVVGTTAHVVGAACNTVGATGMGKGLQGMEEMRKKVATVVNIENHLVSDLKLIIEAKQGETFVNIVAGQTENQEILDQARKAFGAPRDLTELWTQDKNMAAMLHGATGVAQDWETDYVDTHQAVDKMTSEMVAALERIDAKFEKNVNLAATKLADKADLSEIMSSLWDDGYAGVLKLIKSELTKACPGVDLDHFGEGNEENMTRVSEKMKDAENKIAQIENELEGKKVPGNSVHPIFVKAVVARLRVLVEAEYLEGKTDAVKMGVSAFMTAQENGQFKDDYELTLNNDLMAPIRVTFEQMVKNVNDQEKKMSLTAELSQLVCRELAKGGRNPACIKLRRNTQIWNILLAEEGRPLSKDSSLMKWSANTFTIEKEIQANYCAIAKIADDKFSEGDQMTEETAMDISAATAMKSAMQSVSAMVPEDQRAPMMKESNEFIKLLASKDPKDKEALQAKMQKFAQEMQERMQEVQENMANGSEHDEGENNTNQS